MAEDKTMHAVRLSAADLEAIRLIKAHTGLHNLSEVIRSSLRAHLRTLGVSPVTTEKPTGTEG